jgi:hypothetical protein
VHKKTVLSEAHKIPVKKILPYVVQEMKVLRSNSCIRIFVKFENKFEYLVEFDSKFKLYGEFESKFENLDEFESKSNNFVNKNVNRLSWRL